MSRTRKIRSVSRKIEESSEDEIENTNSSIIEVPMISSNLRPDASSDNDLVELVDDGEDVKYNARKRRKPVSKEETISLSVLSKKLISRSNSQFIKTDENNDINNQSWIQKYSPLNSKELAMHPKKLKEIEAAMRSMINGSSQNKILLLTGPAGSGKSTAVKILADEIMATVPSNSKFAPVVDLTVDDVDDEFLGNYHGHRSDNIVEYINSISSTVDQFPDFLNECKMLTGPNLKIIFVEDLPNVFHLETKLKFQKSLIEWMEIPYQLPPLVISISENEFNEDFGNGEMSYNIQNNFVAETIIGSNILNRTDKLQRIKVNPIAKTYLKKPLTQIIKSELGLFDRIPKNVLDRKLNNLSMTGDIRSSINCLEFWARYYDDKGEDDDFLSFGKENNMNLFNAIGKIIYGTSHEDNEIINYQKLNNTEGNELDISKIDQITISNVLSNFFNKSSFFNLNLLENYAMLNSSNFPICGELDKLLDNLSISDVLNKSGLFEIGANVSIRSTRYNMRLIDAKILNGEFNSISKDSSFNKYKNQKLNFSRHYKFLKKINSTKNDIKSYQYWKFNKLCNSESDDDYGPIATSLSADDAMMIDGFFETVILNSVKSENKIRAKIMEQKNTTYVPTSEIPVFPRLGGSFNNKILSDTEMVIEDDYLSFSKNFENYKTVEEMFLRVLTNGFEGRDTDDEGSEFDDDPIEDEDDLKKPKADEFLDDFDDDDSFQDEAW